MSFWCPKKRSSQTKKHPKKGTLKHKPSCLRTPIQRKSLQKSLSGGSYMETPSKTRRKGRKVCSARSHDCHFRPPSWAPPSVSPSVRVPFGGLNSSFAKSRGLRSSGLKTGTETPSNWQRRHRHVENHKRFGGKEQCPNTGPTTSRVRSLL